MVVCTLESMKEDEAFDLIWSKMSSTAETLDIQQPQLPCTRKAPKSYDDGLAEGDFHNDIVANYRQYYYEAIDLATNSIKKRFNQPGY